MANAVKIVIDAATNKMQAGLKSASASLKKFGANAKKLGGALGNAFKSNAKGVAIIGGAVGTLGAVFVKAGADANEMQSKFDAVFKEGADDAEEFAKTLGESTKRSTTELKGMMSSLQDIFVPMGLARDEAQEYSQEMTKLALDVASFNNQSDAKVLEDFKSAMTGSNEVLKKYGVVITEAGIKQEAYRLGLVETTVNELDAQKAKNALEKAEVAATKAKKEHGRSSQQYKDAQLKVLSSEAKLAKVLEGSTGAVSEAAKVQARYSLLLKGTADAQGDAEKTSGSFTNQWKGLQGAVKDANATIGQAILESGTLADVVGKVSGKVKELTERFKDWANDGGIDRLAVTTKVFGIEFISTLKKIKIVSGTVTDTISQYFAWLFENIITGTKNAVNLIQVTFGNMKDNVAKIFQAIWEKIKNPNKPFEPPSLTKITEGFKAIETTMESPIDTWKKGMKEIEAETGKTTDKIDKLNADLAKKEEERVKDKVADFQAAAKAEQEAAKETSKVVVEETEKKTDAAADQLKEVQKIVNALGDADIGNITRSKARNFIRAIELIAKAARDGKFDDLKKVDLTPLKGMADIGFPKNITRAKARSFVGAMDVIRKFAAGGPIGPLGLDQLKDLAGANIAELESLFDAIRRADGAKIEFELMGEAAKHLESIATNTKELPELLKMK